VAPHAQLSRPAPVAKTSASKAAVHFRFMPCSRSPLPVAPL
jgi:hypothetical protein